MESFIAGNTKRGDIEKCKSAGFSEEEAEVVCLFSVNSIRCAVGIAISEGSARFAAITHAAYNVLAGRAKTAWDEKKTIAPKCYR